MQKHVTVFNRIAVLFILFLTLLSSGCGFSRHLVAIPNERTEYTSLQKDGMDFYYAECGDIVLAVSLKYLQSYGRSPGHFRLYVFCMNTSDSDTIVFDRSKIHAATIDGSGNASDLPEYDLRPYSDYTWQNDLFRLTTRSYREYDLDFNDVHYFSRSGITPYYGSISDSVIIIYQPSPSINACNNVRIVEDFLMDLYETEEAKRLFPSSTYLRSRTLSPGDFIQGEVVLGSSNHWGNETIQVEIPVNGSEFTFRFE